MTDSTDPVQQGRDRLPPQPAAPFQRNVNYLPGGTYNIWGQYGGDGTNAASTSSKTQITVARKTARPASMSSTPPHSSGGVSFASGSTGVPYGTQAQS